ncbi:MAG TPA: hypothetical protein V6D18_20960, partial [Thermosynechococcaceae cyanobacterium]
MTAPLQPSVIDPALPSVFRLSAIVRLTLLLLYVALTVPLPFLANVTQSTIPPNLLWVGIGLGAIV